MLPGDIHFVVVLSFPFFDKSSFSSSVLTELQRRSPPGTESYVSPLPVTPPQFPILLSQSLFRVAASSMPPTRSLSRQPSLCAASAMYHRHPSSATKSSDPNWTSSLSYLHCENWCQNPNFFALRYFHLTFSSPPIGVLYIWSSFVVSLKGGPSLCRSRCGAPFRPRIHLSIRF